MNDELEQSDENQDQLEQSNENQEQLIEIYKLQSQLASSISNRRITIHKFYLLLMSGLALILPTFFKLPAEIQSQVSVGFLMIGVSLLGIPLCVTWFILINTNLRMLMLKYETLKRLEDKLEYQFFKEEWKLLENYGKGKTYWEISYIEIFIPIFFFFLFTLLLNAGQINYSGNFFFSWLTYCPTLIAGFYGGYGIRSWQMDRRIRGLEPWKDKRVDGVAYISIGIYLLIILLFRLGYHEAISKEVETINKKPAETSSEKLTETASEETTKKQIILSDGKKQKESKSVDEPFTRATSEEAVKEQPTPSDGKAQNDSP